MLRNIAIVAYLSVSSSFAISLDDMVDNVLKKNQNIKSLEQSILVANKQIDISDNWNNPVLTFGANDVQFEDSLKRDREPMQAQYIGYSQVIPIGEKLEIKKEISIRDKTITTYKLEDQKLKLKSKIYEYGYSIVILEKKYELLNKYLKNIQSLEELSNSLYENGKMKQTDIINLKISYSNIVLKQKNLQNLINNLYLKLSELTYSKIESIELSLDIKAITLSREFNSHPQLLLIKEKSLKYIDVSRLELEKRTSDIKFNIAYFQRDSKYEDYANFSINIPLAIHGTEKINALKAKLKANEINGILNDLENSFKTSVSILQNDLNNSISTYKIIKGTILPLKGEVQENIESYNRFSQITPQDTIKNLNDVIKYELMLLDEMKKYFTAYSKSLYFTEGKI
ncbi:MAG: TolC family protein [Arcobacteraceae bacterium]